MGIVRSRNTGNPKIPSIKIVDLAKAMAPNLKIKIVSLKDDLQALTPSSKCQTELLFTINALRKKKAQIVIACKEPPTQMQNLSSGLCEKLE